jgi:shikimate kinase
MKNVVLIGFMGTGKTSAGRILANRLGYAFVDVDQKIEAAHKMSIKEMFARHGEDYFRSCEKDMVKKLAARHHVVISTGGGTVKNPENMQELRKNGSIIALTASVDVILERTSRRGTRPVLDRADHGDRRSAVAALLEERRTLYAQADYTVDTSRRSPLQVAEEIQGFLRREGAVRA